jgi:hypothetical protein
MFWRKLMAVTLMAVGWVMLVYSLGGAALWAATPSNTCCFPAMVAPPSNPGGCILDEESQFCYVDTTKLVTCQGTFADVVAPGNNCAAAALTKNCTAGMSNFFVYQYTSYCDPIGDPCACAIEQNPNSRTTVSAASCTGDYCQP